MRALGRARTCWALQPTVRSAAAPPGAHRRSHPSRQQHYTCRHRRLVVNVRAASGFAAQLSSEEAVLRRFAALARAGACGEAAQCLGTAVDDGTCSRAAAAVASTATLRELFTGTSTSSSAPSTLAPPAASFLAAQRGHGWELLRELQNMGASTDLAGLKQHTVALTYGCTGREELQRVLSGMRRCDIQVRQTHLSTKTHRTVSVVPDVAAAAAAAAGGGGRVAGRNGVLSVPHSPAILG